MGFFGNLKEMAKAVNEALKPKTILDHVHERIKALDEEMQSGRRFVSIRKIWDWMKENEQMRLLNCDRINARLQEELAEIEKKKAKDNFDIQGREFPSKEILKAADKITEDAKTIEDAIKTVREANDCLADRLASKKKKSDEEKDRRYFGETHLLKHWSREPQINDIVLVRRKDDGIWTASTVQAVEGRAVWCGDDWYEEHFPYQFNEELIGTAREPKDPRKLRWGDKVWVCDDLKDEPEIALFLGFRKDGESDLRWLTLSSPETCLECFSEGKWAPFGHWKYMWPADGQNDLD